MAIKTTTVHMGAKSYTVVRYPNGCTIACVNFPRNGRNVQRELPNGRIKTMIIKSADKIFNQ